MAATQRVVPTAPDLPQSRSRALTAAVIGLAVVAALALAGIVGASSPGDGSRRSLTPYDWSHSNSLGVNGNGNSPYPAAGNR